MADSASPTGPKPDQPAADLAARYAAISLPPAMAAIPEALEGMQFSQDFSGSAQQLQTDIDTLRLSLETLDFGRARIGSVIMDYVASHADKLMSFTGGLISIPDAIHLTQQHTLSPDTDSHKPLANGAVHLQSAADHITTIPEKLERDDGPGTDDLSAFLSGKQHQ